MRITQALLGEHGAMYPLLDYMEKSAPLASLEQIRAHTHLLQAALLTHADLEEALLRPALLPYLAAAETGPDGVLPPTDHQIIAAGLTSVIEAAEENVARQRLLDTIAVTRTHFRKEENEIFPIVGRHLAVELQQELGARWAALRNVNI